MDWYAFYVKTGREDSLCSYFEYLLRKGDICYKLMIPKRELIEYKSGIRRTVYKPLFPGYILIHTESIYKIYDAMKRLWHSEVYNLIRTKECFQKIEEEEMEPILGLINNDGIIKISKIYIKNNGIVAIDGTLLHYSGAIRKINPRKGRAKISLDFLNGSYNFDVGVSCLYKGTEDIRI